MRNLKIHLDSFIKNKFKQELKSEADNKINTLKIKRKSYFDLIEIAILLSLLSPYKSNELPKKINYMIKEWLKYCNSNSEIRKEINEEVFWRKTLDLLEKKRIFLDTNGYFSLTREGFIIIDNFLKQYKKVKTLSF